MTMSRTVSHLNKEEDGGEDGMVIVSHMSPLPITPLEKQFHTMMNKDAFTLEEVGTTMIIPKDHQKSNILQQRVPASVLVTVRPYGEEGQVAISLKWLVSRGSEIRPRNALQMTSYKWTALDRRGFSSGTLTTLR